MYWGDNGMKGRCTQESNFLDTAGQNVQTRNNLGQFLFPVFDSLPLPVFALDMKGTVILWNCAAKSVFEFDRREVLAKPNPIIADERAEEFKYCLRAALEEQKTDCLKTTCRTKSGKHIDVAISCSPLTDLHHSNQGVLVIVVDLTESVRVQNERAQFEKQLRQTEKIKALGAVAGGIAHNFNNLIHAILGYAELTMADVPEGSSTYDNLEHIVQAGKRAAGLVNQILSFSRQNKPKRRPLALQEVVSENISFLRQTLPETVHLKEIIDSHCGLVLADPAEIGQVVMNLSINANHAMRECGGTLGIHLEQVEVDPFTAEQHRNLKPGTYARLKVSDTGHGMDQATMEKIFEPFFTTKKVGEGTGMGLAFVFKVVRSYQGTVKVQSEPGGGTIIDVYLPVLDDPEFEQSEEHRAKELPRGDGHILFVDDEELIARMGTRMFSHMGYEVSAFTSSTRALGAFCLEPDKFDVVITDQTMPDLTGTQLARYLKQIRSDIPVILCTGYVELLDEQKVKDIGITAFVAKPISMHEMAETLKLVLNENQILLPHM